MVAIVTCAHMTRRRSRPILQERRAKPRHVLSRDGVCSSARESMQKNPGRLHASLQHQLSCPCNSAEQIRIRVRSRQHRALLEEPHDAHADQILDMMTACISIENGSYRASSCESGFHGCAARKPHDICGRPHGPPGKRPAQTLLRIHPFFPRVSARQETYSPTPLEKPTARLLARVHWWT
jgi:hypothetical protein